MSINVYKYLLDYDIKPSVQRIAIMEYLLKHHTHPCVDEIYMALHNDIPTLSKTTVYNTLKLFAGHGAAKMLTIDERNIHFDGDTSAHAHFLCKCCGRIFDMPMHIDEKEMNEMTDKGFSAEEVHSYYKGVCPECKKKRSDKN